MIVDFILCDISVSPSAQVGAEHQEGSAEAVLLVAAVEVPPPCEDVGGLLHCHHSILYHTLRHSLVFCSHGQRQGQAAARHPLR